MNEINLTAMSIKDLDNLQIRIFMELEKRNNEKKEKMWKDIQNAISAYTDEFGAINIQAYGFEYTIHGQDDFSECGVIEILRR